MDDLESLLKNDEPEKATPTPASGETQEQKTDVPTDPEVLKKEQIKANLDKAILEAQDELKRIRKEKQKAKSVPEEEELPKIDMEDPSAQAWDRHIRSTVDPVRQESEQEKSEVRQAALQKFLVDKPALAKSQDKMKELMAEYESLSKGKISEKTQEGVLMFLDKAYASVFHKELLDAARGRQVEKAQADILFSDIAVSRGATTYSQPQPVQPKLTDEEREIVQRWDKQLAGLGIGEK